MNGSGTGAAPVKQRWVVQDWVVSWWAQCVASGWGLKARAANEGALRKRGSAVSAALGVGKHQLRLALQRAAGLTPPPWQGACRPPQLASAGASPRPAPRGRPCRCPCGRKLSAPPRWGTGVTGCCTLSLLCWGLCQAGATTARHRLPGAPPRPRHPPHPAHLFCDRARGTEKRHTAKQVSASA